MVLYSGQFDKNYYEGEGTQSYENGVVHYKGNFHANLYEGQGALFRENGTREYEGDFFAGMKEGEGNEVANYEYYTNYATTNSPMT